MRWHRAAAILIALAAISQTAGAQIQRTSHVTPEMWSDTLPVGPDSVTSSADTTAGSPQGAGDVTAVVPTAGTNGDPGLRAEACALGAHRAPAQVAAGAVFAGTNVQLYRYFKRAWWSGEKADRFFFRSDWDEAFRDQDKFGHLIGGYHLTRGGYTLLRGACVSQKKAVLYSAAYATLFQLQIEIWDGLYEKYGFSYPDLLANTAGMALGVLHATRPGSRVVKPTISYRQTAAMKQRQDWDEIRHTTDYSGQTYWFSFDVDAILPEQARAYWPGIVRLSVGHSITDWILPRPPGAPEGTPQGVVRARRRILLSLDLDAEKLPGNHPVWNFVKQQLSYIRFPAPALQITPSVDLLRWYR